MRHCVFKVAYSSRSFTTSFPMDISYGNFIHELSLLIQQHFGFQQYVIINGEYLRYHPEFIGIIEDAPHDTLQNIHNTITCSNANNITFYVKNTEMVECMICYEPIQSQPNTMNYFQCSHTFCFNCINQCLQHNRVHCPVCQHQRIFNNNIRPVAHHGRMMIVDMR